MPREAYDPRTDRPASWHAALPGIRAGTDTPRDFLERCVATIEAREPEVKAFVTLDIEGSRREADAATARWRDGAPLSAIDGMPTGVKDLIETRNLPTRMGSPLFADNFPRRDSASVQALRRAGAIVLGKCVTTELGMSHPGPTVNPFDPGRTAGGSSTGSAAAVGAAMIPAAIGTQVLGSIIRPASFCANRALKPTQGAINRGERLGLSQATAGLHGASLADAWVTAMAISTRVGGDPGSPGLFGGAEMPEARRPARLALFQSAGWEAVDAATRGAFEEFVRRLERAGVQIVRREREPLLDALERAVLPSMELTRDVLAWEMAWGLENLAALDAGKMSDSLKARLAVGREMSLDDYRVRLGERAEMRARLAALAPLVDGLIAPAACGPAPEFGDTGGSDGRILHTTGNPAMNAASSCLGAPVVTVPVMAVGGMPVGVQVMGQWHEDERVTAIARWIEEHVEPVVVAG